jgi:hypothetical protein
MARLTNFLLTLSQSQDVLAAFLKDVKNNATDPTHPDVLAQYLSTKYPLDLEDATAISTSTYAQNALAVNQQVQYEQMALATAPAPAKTIGIFFYGAIVTYYG